MSSGDRRVNECACCGEVGRLSARGLIASCTARYRELDRLEEWPTSRELVAEDVRMVLATGARYVEVASRCGVTKRTVVRVVARDRLGVVAGAGRGRPASSWWAARGEAAA